MFQKGPKVSVVGVAHDGWVEEKLIVLRDDWGQVLLGTRPL